MVRPSRFIPFALAFALMVLSATTALAAPATWQRVDVTLHSEQTGSVVLVSGQLPQNAVLPAQAELPVPAGSEIQWIGQILGGSPESDPELKYAKTSSEGVDVYRFTLTESRIAQIEIPTSAGQLFDGSRYTSSLKWMPTQDIPEVRLSVRVPMGAQVAQAVPGASIQPGESGYSYYIKTAKNVKAGDPLDLTFAYTLPAAGPAAGATSGSSSPDTQIIVFIVIGLIGAFGFLVFKVKRTAARQPEALEETRSPQERPGVPESASTENPESEPAEHADDAPRPTKKVNMKMMTGAVVGALLLGVVVAGGNGTTARVNDGKIKRSFGAASPCTSASIPVVANQGVDLATQGEKLVDAFTGKEGIGDVTLDLARSTVDIAFCESSQTQDSIRQILISTGLVTAGAAPVTPVPAAVK